MEITTVGTDAVDALAELWVALAGEQLQYGSHLLADPNEDRAREAMARRVVAGDVLLARADGDAIGFVAVGVEDGSYAQNLRRGVVRDLYVRPDHRDEGVGSALLAAAEDRLADQDVDAVALESLAANEAARRFYRRHGYEPHRVELEKRLEGADGDRTETG